MTSLVLRSVRRPGETDLLDVRIRDGVVESITASGSVSASGVPAEPGSVEEIDAGGRFLIPGLWDEHAHITTWALTAKRVDLSAADSAAATLALIAGFPTDTASPGNILVGVGFRDAVWGDEPSLRAIDEAMGDRPTVLVSHDLHCVWMNSLAATTFGVSLAEDGLLREDDAFEITQALADLPDTLIDAWVAEAAAGAAARGVVGVVDLEMAWNRDGWLRRFGGGFRTFRVDVGVYAEHLDLAIAEGLRTGEPISDASADLLRTGPLKVLIDGSLNTRTAYCVDAYPNGGHGMLTVTEEELVALLERATAAGFTPAVHAIGDAANRIALNAYERVGVAGRVEHAQFLRPEEVARFGALGVTASVQPEHALDDRDAAELNWPGQTDRAFPLRSLREAGATLAFGSDAPVAPLDPWITMSAATARARDDGREPWHPEQAVSRRDALTASSRGRTEVAVGDVADIVLLDADPLEVDDDVFRRMPVAATLLAGRFTFRSDAL
ncbi:amidohydrolase [Labedella endophytica]|uniref:Amidohydrolase n=1 Tax=Labedella endophytica TaxID=1523160 RepID=A0A3S0VRL3_9MICO|nr:amidohydrolase family protein [Labedella endophytica]RUQ98126.1 amidohydrolase [Labedella endophytica]